MISLKYVQNKQTGCIKLDKVLIFDIKNNQNIYTAKKLRR